MRTAYGFAVALKPERDVAPDPASALTPAEKAALDEWCAKSWRAESRTLTDQPGRWQVRVPPPDAQKRFQALHEMNPIYVPDERTVRARFRFGEAETALSLALAASGGGVSAAQSPALWSVCAFVFLAAPVVYMWNRVRETTVGDGSGGTQPGG